MHSRFEGMYFKQQAGERMIAFIPAVHTDKNGNRSSSLQVITRDGAHYIELDGGDVQLDRRTKTARGSFGTLSAQGIDLELDHPELQIRGSLRFHDAVPPRGDIMGPYQFVPFMECRHAVFSLSHGIDGSLTVNGETLDFSKGIGYIEGDRGRSFPSRYIWTHCAWQSPARASVMLSAATVNPMGRSFTGIIGFVYVNKKEYRIATYRGAKLHTIDDGVVTVRQGPYELTVRLLKKGGQTLSAPVAGAMTRLIRESLACPAAYRFTDNGRVLFDFETEQASFEYEW